MKYYTGSVANWTAIRDAVIAAGNENGWTWDATKNIIKKGTTSAFKIDTTSSTLAFIISCGIGTDGAGALLTPCPFTVQMMSANNASNDLQVVWPVEYRIFVYDTPNMIAIAVRYNASAWQYAMFGEAVSLGVPGNAGVVPWMFASFNSLSTAYTRYLRSWSQYQAIAGSGNNETAPFSSWPSWNGQDSSRSSIDIDGGANSYAYVNTPAGFCSFANNADGGPAVTWSGTITGRCQLSSSPFMLNDVLRQPNQWNGVAVLLPFNVYVIRPQGFHSPAFEIKHVTFTRNDNYLDGDIKIEGSQKWMILPQAQRNTVSRDETFNTTTSGTRAFAFEYQDS